MEASVHSPVIRNDQYLLIIGAMKAGTTTLFHYLSQHEKICSAEIKEPEYFSSFRKQKNLEIARYEDLWKFDPHRHDFAMEASTGYSKPSDLTVPRRIYEHGLRPKFLYILRDPFERIESHFNFESRSRRRQVRGNSILKEGIIQTSNYAKVIDCYVSTFGQNSLYLIDFDDLSKKPLETVNKILEFAGLDELVELRDVGAKNPTDYQMTFVEASTRRFLQRYAVGAPQSVRKYGKSILRLIPKAGKKTVLTVDQREQVYCKLRDGMKILNERYGVDVAKWGF